MIQKLKKHFLTVVIFLSALIFHSAPFSFNLSISANAEAVCFDLYDETDYEVDYYVGTGGKLEIQIGSHELDGVIIKRNDKLLGNEQGEIIENTIVLYGNYLYILYESAASGEPVSARFKIYGFEQSRIITERFLIVVFIEGIPPVAGGGNTDIPPETNGGGELPENELSETTGGGTVGGKPRKKGGSLEISPVAAAGLYIGGGAVCVSLSVAAFVFLFKKKKLG